MMRKHRSWHAQQTQAHNQTSSFRSHRDTSPISMRLVQLKPLVQPCQASCRSDCHSGLSRYANGLLGIDPKAARVTWTVFLVALLLATAFAVRETLAVFVIALLFAYLLLPLVGFVERITPHQVSPRIALAIVYLVLVGAIVTFALTLGSRLAD